MIENLTKEIFLEKIFNFEENKGWKFEGKRAAVAGVYADCCGPCKMISFVLEELSKVSNDKINIYKVGTETE